MQTAFTPAQLRDPATAEANSILRACVHCGLCTATCPSYQVLGDELDSPRGRIYLIKDMLENDRDPDPETVTHLDRCLGCLACTTTCPSGVDYMHLLEHARDHVESRHRRPWRDRALRALLAGVLPHPRRFRLALRAAKIGQPFRRLLPDRRLRAMMDMVPARTAASARHDEPGLHPALGESRRRVALMTGCAQKVLDADINAATIRLLTRLGCDVVIPEDTGCCGALVQHMGRTQQAKNSAAQMIRAVTAAGELDAFVVNTSGCGTSIKDWGHLFRGDPLEVQAADVAAKARDVSELLEELMQEAEVTSVDPARTGVAGTDASPADRPWGRVESGPHKGLRVAYHAACSLQHGQRVKTAPKALLAAAGFEVMEPADSHLCCGSAGTYNLMQPEISAALRERKVGTIEALTPDVIATGNIGCMMQIGGATGVPVVHTVELLDWATGGPRPSKLV
ncbi:glycolate oxidase subunit GlcF [Roseicyclus sp. F158]|uniref:Glycolate oxidase iron-sulfur subunit n=1 Tax=Tropicimonas omnivorans TaxID=3075590 RepID=A0ABU3DHG0_9RHOB|nr:glycolate oxidase subunit GlcF [Roseicyclus sp. F158]MDT0683148.1 glycolate oxidase subunit GlcF [Roseicyclus sp. F158]